MLFPAKMSHAEILSEAMKSFFQNSFWPLQNIMQVPIPK